MSDHETDGIIRALRHDIATLRGLLREVLLERDAARDALARCAGFATPEHVEIVPMRREARI